MSTQNKNQVVTPEWIDNLPNRLLETIQMAKERRIRLAEQRVASWQALEKKLKGEPEKMSKRLNKEELTELAKRIETRMVKTYGTEFPTGEGYTPIWEDMLEALEDTQYRSYDAFKIGQFLDRRGWEVDLDLLEVIDSCVIMYFEDKRKTEASKGGI